MIRIGIFGAILTILAGTVASATTTDWGIMWSLVNGGDLGCTIGTFGVSTDGYDRGIDAQAVYSVSDVTAGLFPWHTQGDNWAGKSNFYNGDFKAPLKPGETKTWDNIYCWIVPDWDVKTINVAIQGMSLPTGPFAPPSDWTYKMYLDYVPDSITYNGPREWSINPTTGTLITLPAYKSTIGTDGLRLRFTATATPEPASLLGLAGGALGLFGLVRRRK